jgi:hypothetical protein
MFDQLLLAWDDSVERMAEGWDALAERLRDLRYPLPFLYLTSTCSPVLWAGVVEVRPGRCEAPAVA